MITSKKELHEFIKEDRKNNINNCSKIYLTFEPLLSILGVVRESFYVRRYLKVLRKLEYFSNKKNKGIMYIYYMIMWKRLSHKYQIYIRPNTVGKGLHISHFNGGIQINCFQMGNYCSVTAGVVIGNKGSQENRAIIGNNVSFTIGSKAIGKIIIEDNVIVCPNSVVIKDVPNGAIVSGVPAQIIKIKN